MNAVKAKFGVSPSYTLRTMVQGLLNHSKRENFRVAMNTFGAYDDTYEICFGCVATVTIQELSGRSFDGREINNVWSRARFLELKEELLDEFEDAVDAARCGELSRLLMYFNVPEAKGISNIFKGRWELLTDDWQDQLPAVLQAAEELEKLGL